jgi:hypothetical protein
MTQALRINLLLLALCPQGFGLGHEGHRIVSSKTATSNFE